MDDFTLATLQDSRNEWCMQLVNILTPVVIEGFNSIFQESWKLCESNDEEDKYLMTFQNFITRVPKWNPDVIQKETTRILERSACSYLEDLLTCVHVIQLKVLTCIRVSKNQKKIDINIPKLDDFIHKLYINVARKLYSNVYLYDKFVTPLQKQKHNREFEVIVQECILNAIRGSMPIEEILRAYLDETIEEDVEETIKETEVPVEEEVSTDETDTIDAHDTRNVKDDSNNVSENEVKQEVNDINENVNDVNKEISFSDNLGGTNEELNDTSNEIVMQNNLINNLDEISKLRNNTFEDNNVIAIADDLDKSELNIETLGGSKINNNEPPILNDIQILV